MEEVDRLFKEKLDGYELTPPLATWDKLESKINKKGRRPVWLWMRIAASLLVLALCAWMVTFWIKNDRPSSNELTKSTQIIPEKESTPTIDANSIDDKKQNQIAEGLSTEEPVIGDQELSTVVPTQKTAQVNDPLQAKIESVPEQTTRNNKPNPLTTTLASKQEADQSTDKKTPLSPELEIDISSALEDPNSAPVAKASTPRMPIRITYKKGVTAKETTLLAMADGDENEANEKTSKFKKVFQKAQQIKEQDLGLSKIRAAKDELLAFRWEKKNNRESRSN